MKPSRFICALVAVVAVAATRTALAQDALEKLNFHIFTVYETLSDLLKQAPSGTTAAEIIKQTGTSCMEAKTIGSLHWPSAPAEATKCSIQASGRTNFYVTISSNASTGNKELSIGSKNSSEAKQRELQDHANNVWKALTAGSAEFDKLTLSQILHESGTSCLKSGSFRSYTWNAAPKGTISCTMKAPNKDGFVVLIAGDASTGNYKYSSPN